MIVDAEMKQILIEPRDINFFLQAYINQYMYIRKGESPERILFPKYRSVPHPTAESQVFVEWLELDDPYAQGIIHDGKDIPEITPEVEQMLNDKDEEIRRLKEQLEQLPEVANDTD